MADNSYPIEIKIMNKAGYHTPAEARAYYGRYDRNGITVHWWGDGTGASNHDNIVNYISGRAAKGQASVNYVLSDNKITLGVNPDNVAWCSQNGNPTTISVECQPTLGAEGYKKMGWLIDQLEQRYGRSLTLFPHNHWFATACPGTLDLNRMRAEADKWKRGEYDAKPAPQPQPTPTPAPTPQPAAKPEMVFRRFDSGEVRRYKANKATQLYAVDKNSWPEITGVKPYNAGDTVDIVGTVLNKKLNATYLLTDYSMQKNIANGFSQADWDRVVPPVVVPEPPKPLPSQPSTAEPTDYDKSQDARLSAIEAFIEAIKKFFGGK